MSREIKDIMDRHSKKKVYPRTHIKAVLMDSETSLETFLGENIPYRIQKLESIITDTGDGTLFLSNDGTYKELEDYLSKIEASNIYTPISTFNPVKELVETINADYITNQVLNTSVINALKNYMTTELIQEALEGKVDKNGNKQLSTEDFTTEAKNKLESLENYDDTSVRGLFTQLSDNTADAVSLADFMGGVSIINSLANIPITYRLVIANVFADCSLTLAGTPDAGREIHVIIHNTSDSDIAVTLPNSGNYVNTLDSVFSITAKSYAEINFISDGGIIYIKYI